MPTPRPQRHLSRRGPGLEESSVSVAHTRRSNPHAHTPMLPHHSGPGASLPSWGRKACRPRLLMPQSYIKRCRSRSPLPQRSSCIRADASSSFPWFVAGNHCDYNLKHRRSCCFSVRLSHQYFVVLYYVAIEPWVVIDEGLRRFITGWALKMSGWVSAYSDSNGETSSALKPSEPLLRRESSTNDVYS